MTTAKRFLVTGGAGFIGSAVVRQLVGGTPHEVAVVDKLTYAGNLDSLAPAAGSPRYRFFRDDITNAHRMTAIIEAVAPDVIIHLAAETHVDRSIDAAGAFVDTNIVGTFVLLQAALDYWRKLPKGLQRTFRFLHVSTDEVFGSLAADEGAFTEATRYSPNSPYAASKAASDHIVRAWHRTYGLPVIVSNCGNNFGPYQFPEKLIPLMIVKCLEGEPLPVYGTGANLRDWVYVVDHAAALLLVAERGTAGETYLIGGDNGLSNIAVVRAICATVDRCVGMAGTGARDGLIQFVPDRPGHDFRYAIDSAKIRRDLGWRPTEPFEGGLEKTVTWYVANAAWWRPIRDRIYGGQRLGLNPVSS